MAEVSCGGCFAQPVGARSCAGSPAAAKPPLLRCLLPRRHFEQPRQHSFRETFSGNTLYGLSAASDGYPVQKIHPRCGQWPTGKPPRNACTQQQRLCASSAIQRSFWRNPTFAQHSRTAALVMNAPGISNERLAIAVRAANRPVGAFHHGALETPRHHLPPHSRNYPTHYLLGGTAARAVGGQQGHSNLPSIPFDQFQGSLPFVPRASWERNFVSGLTCLLTC